MRLMLSVASYILMLLSGGVASLGLGIGNIYYLIAGSVGVVVFAALKRTASF